MTLEQIKNKIENKFNVDLKDPSKEEDIIKAKYLYVHCAYFYSTEITSTIKIAKSIGYKQHASVNYALKEFENFRRFDKMYKLISDIFINELIEDLSFLELKHNISKTNKKAMLQSKLSLFKEQIELLNKEIVASIV